MQPQLKHLVEKGLLWQGKDSATQHREYLTTGSHALDEQLGGGWQQDGLHECQLSQPFTEQRLLKPLLKQAVTLQQPIFWITPPALLSAAGLAWQLTQSSRQIVVQATGQQAAWAFEQILQSGTGMAFLWAPAQALEASMVRRWYKAIQLGGLPGFVFTNVQKQEEARSYTNRLRLTDNGQRVAIIKRRYGWPVADIAL